MTTAQGGLLVAILATLFVPGLLLGLSAGLRGWLLLGASPVLTYGLIGIVAPILPMVFGRWSLAGFGLSVALGCALVFGIRLVARPWTGTLRTSDALVAQWRPVHHAGVATALLFTALLGMFVVGQATTGFTAVHQFWDAILHANATRFIFETGRSAPTDLVAITPSKPPLYYPNAFHVHLATVLALNDGPVVDLLNLREGVTAAVFGLAMVALLRQSGSRPALVAAVAAICAAFSLFPYDLGYFGPLWPFSAAVAVLPGFLALFITSLRRPHPAIVAVTGVAMLGLAAIHPSVAVAAAVFGMAFVAQRWITLRRFPLPDLAVLAVFGIAAAVLVLPMMIGVRRNSTYFEVDWPVIGNPGSALGQLLFLNHDSPFPQWWLVAAMAAGLLAIRHLVNLFWWLAGGVVFTVLYVMAAAYEGPLVALVTGPWWNDRWRFLALVAPVLIVVAGHGIVFIRDQALLRLPASRHSSLVWRCAALFAVIALLGVLSDGMYRDHNVRRVAAAYTDGPMLSGEERAALTELTRMVPAGATVMNDPNDGSPWMWALNGLHPVFGQAIPPGTIEKTVDADRALLYSRFDQVDTDPAVRDAVRRLHIKYVFVGAGFASPTSSRAPGLDHLDQVSSLDKVYGNDAAAIYRVGPASAVPPEASLILGGGA